MFNLGIFKNLKVILALSMAGILISGYFYIKVLKNDIDELKLENGLLTNSIQEQQIVINTMESDVKLIKKTNKELNETSYNQQLEIIKLKKTFNTKSNGESRDLGKLAEKKPKLIQNIVNSGTLEVNRCFELITGAELTKGETNETIQKCTK